jgi:Ca2+-binding RTX toxin-like protein
MIVTYPGFTGHTVTLTITGMSISANSFSKYLTHDNEAGFYNAITSGNDLFKNLDAPGGKGDDTFDTTLNASGGAGNDTFYLPAHTTDLDFGTQINGGSGSDTLVFRGNILRAQYQQTTAAFINIEKLSFEAGHAHLVELVDSNVTAGRTLVLSSETTGASDIVSVDAQLESDGHISLFGGASSDRIGGGQLGDVLRGGAGSDTLRGNGGNDTLRGDDGNDVLNGGSGVDSFRGGAGSDSVSFKVTEGTTGAAIANLATGTITDDGFGNSETMISIEQLSGTSGFGDQLTGDSHANMLYGNGGDDVLSGGGGKDWIEGDSGADTLTGGGGSDSFIYFSPGESTAATADTITDFTSGVDKIELLTSVQAIDATVTAASLDDLDTAADAAHLGLNDALLANVGGTTYLVIDENGTAGYQADDIVIRMPGVTSIQLSDFAIFTG